MTDWPDDDREREIDPPRWTDADDRLVRHAWGWGCAIVAGAGFIVIVF